MKKIQLLSIIIHDDHSSLWINMNYTLLNNWYSLYDVCLLNNYNRNYINTNNVTEVNNMITGINKKCLKLTNSKKTNMLCNIGAAVKDTSCYVNLTSRTYYKSMINDNILGDPNNMLLKTSIYELSKSNKAIIFIGDGITKQSQDAMICELLRTDQAIKIYSKSSIYSTNYTLKWIKQKRKLDIYYFRLVYIN